MGNYIDTDDVRQKLRDDFDGFYSLPDDQPALDADLAAVEAFVDTYVGKRYAVPITATAALAILTPLALDLMAERAHARGQGGEIQAKIVAAADTARKTLEAMAKGIVTLAGAEGLTERPSGGADAIIVDGNAPEFTKDDLDGF